VGRVTTGDPAKGEALFKMTTLPGGKPGCATCHTLAAAGTTGTIGPNLDEAFAADKDPTFSSGEETIQTIQDVVRGQIAYAESTTGTASPGMPANLLTGQDAKDVAVFVAQCADVSHCKVGSTPSALQPAEPPGSPVAP
jgi:mono/diheme cytochrome c family protein